jgi:hypothetical protein
MMAARGNHASTVNLLLDQGADPQVKNQLGITALEFAKHYNAPDAIEILSKRTVRVGASAPADAKRVQNDGFRRGGGLPPQIVAVSGLAPH